jgi:hypothetical protein
VVTAIRTRPTPLGLAQRALADVPKETRTFLLEDWQQKLIIYPNFKDVPALLFIAVVPKELVERID